MLMLTLMMIMIASAAVKSLPATPLQARRAQGERSIADISTILQLPLPLIMTILMMIDYDAAPAAPVEADEMANALIARPVPKMSAIALINVSQGYRKSDRKLIFSWGFLLRTVVIMLTVVR